MIWNSFWPACFRSSFSFLNLYLTKLFYSPVIASTGCLFYRSLNICFRLSSLQFKLFGWSRITVYYSHLFLGNLRLLSIQRFRKVQFHRTGPDQKYCQTLYVHNYKFTSVQTRRRWQFIYIFLTDQFDQCRFDLSSQACLPYSTWT